MTDWDYLLNLSKRLCEIGKKHEELPNCDSVEQFKSFFSEDGILQNLDVLDGSLTRREVLARYLLVNCVLDQGPDPKGVRLLLANVTTELYSHEIRIFHNPVSFFKEVGISIDTILDKHKSIKDLRAKDWAINNKTKEDKYILFFTNSARGIISINQILDYSVHRWGTPLMVPYILERDLLKKDSDIKNALVEHIESYESAEKMSSGIKDDNRYGLGSAIGDKACHLFTKYYVSRYKLVKSKKNDKGWTDLSYEVPFDSNAGRVLLRTGFLTSFAPIDFYEDRKALIKGEGKGGLTYLRVTNLRGIKISDTNSNSIYFQDYKDLVINYLKVNKNPKSMEIQRIPNLLLMELKKRNVNYSIADFDDGLMYIGTTYCFNTDEPKCEFCDLNDICKANLGNKNLITDFRT